MAESTQALRLAYIRTTATPTKSREETYEFLRDHMRQQRPELWNSRPKHRYVFGASNTFDENILDVLLETIPYDPNIISFRDIQKSDLELRMSEARASTGPGQKILRRCTAGGIQAVVDGKDDDECDANMLEQCDYLIDVWTTYHYLDWYWKYAWTGKVEDNMLTNPYYNVGQHDKSKTRLRDRYNGYAWRESSGGCHGTSKTREWRCSKCGAKCKRDQCKRYPFDELPIFKWTKMPERGSEEWKDLTANDVLEQLRMQKWSGRHIVEDLFSQSIDTFSGE